jgi:hypothetical protein
MDTAVAKKKNPFPYRELIKRHLKLEYGQIIKK